jgi:hypothetical protein
LSRRILIISFHIYQIIQIVKLSILAMIMTATANLPCGCILNWGDNKVKAALCIGHTLAFVTWEGSKQDFVKKLATPETSK